VLAGLIRHHVQAIPFENLDILLGRPILIDLDSVQAKLVAERRGGYCFEQNTLFAAVLRELGFAVTTLAGRVRLGAPEAVPTPRTHMVLRVEFPDDGGPWLADVGFGFSPTGPLRLVAGLEQELELDYTSTHPRSHFKLGPLVMRTDLAAGCRYSRCWPAISAWNSPPIRASRARQPAPELAPRGVVD
jgi:arylamine N-acetyltransferase